MSSDNTTRPARGRRTLFNSACALLVVLTLVRVATTHREFSQTIDEPVHIAAGMQWFASGSYSLDPEHPPLARIAAAAGPYLSGIHEAKRGTPTQRGNAELNENRHYLGTLARARLGILPFLALALLVVWLWSRELFGAPAALVSVVLFATLPPILGHAGLATTDMAVTATIAAALYTLHRYLRKPVHRRAVLLGLCSGLALASKISALVFLPLGAIPVAAAALAVRRQNDDTQPVRARRWQTATIALLVALATVWGTYRFSFGRPQLPAGSWAETTRGAAAVVGNLTSVPLPAPELFAGLRIVTAHQERGHGGYLFGKVRPEGAWYYYPVAIGLKTPIPFLIFALLTIPLLFRREQSSRRWVAAAPFIAATLMLLFTFVVRIQIGVRHVLPLYPLLAIGAGFVVVELWRRDTAARVAVASLVAWQLVSSSVAHPDYFPWFNALAGNDPARLMSDSNVDWGQDFLRLRRELRARNIGEAGYVCFTNLDARAMALPQAREVDRLHPTAGWIAVSDSYRVGAGVQQNPGDYAWINFYRPVTRVGKSMGLYYIPGPESFAPARAPLPKRAPVNLDSDVVVIPFLLANATPDAAGRKWQTELSIANRSTRDVFLYRDPERRAPFIGIAAGTELPNPYSSSESAGRLLFAKRGDLEDVDVRLRLVELPAGRVTFVPVSVVQPSAAGPVVLENVPAKGRGVRLRIYSIYPKLDSVAVSFTHPGDATPFQTTQHSLWSAASADIPAYTEIPLGDVGGDAVHVTVDGGGSLVCALASETSPDGVVTFYRSKAVASRE